MDRLQSGKELHGKLANLQGMVHIHAVVRDRVEQRIPAFRLQVLSRAGTAIVFRGHLCQQAVA
jgi:hypothetical protein